MLNYNLNQSDSKVTRSNRCLCVYTFIVEIILSSEQQKNKETKMRIPLKFYVWAKDQLIVFKRNSLTQIEQSQFLIIIFFLFAFCLLA